MTTVHGGIESGGSKCCQGPSTGRPDKAGLAGFGGGRSSELRSPPG
jgi:hypothetical protein